MKDLYKYFGINEFLFSTLKDNKIWFSNPNSFNDPFDCNVKCKYLEDLMFQERIHNDLRDVFNSVDNNESYFRERKISLTIADSHETKRKEETRRLNQELHDTVDKTGVSCFSEKMDSILMWSHYTEDHKGVCLQFNPSDKLFSEKCERMIYVDEFPNIDSKRIINEPNNFLFFTKSNEWRYESEVRVIKDSNSLHSFSPKSLIAIYFGVNCDPDDVKKIKDIINNHSQYENVSFHKMNLSTEGFKLLPENINN